MHNKSNSSKEILIGKLIQVHKYFIEGYSHSLKEKYIVDKCFKEFIDKEYRKDITLYVHKMGYTIINKMLFIKICKDKGFSIENKVELWMNLILKYTVEDLLKIYLKKSKKEDKESIINEGLEYIEDTQKLRKMIQNFIEEIDFLFCTKGTLLGDVYEKFMDEETRKELGQFYTPKSIIEYILKNTIDKEDIIQNPFLRILDPACGSGHFLVMAYDLLRKKFENKLDVLKEKYENEEYEIKKKDEVIKIKGKAYWKKENLHYHILKHCIYGADIDPFAIQLTIINLLLKDIDNFTDEINIIHCDSLVRWEENCKERNKVAFWKLKYDYVIGNPPYVGHKQLSMDYKKWLLKEYNDIFKDKSDLSYCFFKRIVEVLKKDGKACIITTRYFMESPTGRELRCYLKNNTRIEEIIDFYGGEIFKGVGVASAIFTFKKEYVSKNNIIVCKLKDDGYSFDKDYNLREVLKETVFERFTVGQEDLKEERWILISKDKFKIYKKIEEYTPLKLKDIAISFQGIITGCDKAFVLEYKEMEKNKIEVELQRKWIKNKNVNSYYITESDLMLIYADLIEDESKYKNSLNYIRNFKSRLENRRECKNGIRKWYQLQWGRKRGLFESPKIVYPYKAGWNKFAIDENQCFCSADIYSFYIKESFNKIFSLEYLVAILNSKIYEFYFKIFAKKMGGGIYDYYPNSVMDLKIVKPSNYKKIESKGKEIIALYKVIKEIEEQSKIAQIIEKVDHLEKEIEELLSEAIGIDAQDMKIIDAYIKKSSKKIKY